MTMEILVAGEALIDMTPIAHDDGLAFQPRPGGSPLNVAIGLARLERAAGFLGAVSTDPFGQTLRDHLIASDVDPRYVQSRSELSTLAFVHPGASEADEPQYTFYGEGAADTQLRVADLPERLPESISALHTGSIATVREPVSSALAELLRREHSHRLISFDPNVRPELMGDADEYRSTLEGWLAHVDVVKTSRADLAWIAPNQRPIDIAEQWLKLGPQAIVVTLGAEGAIGLTQDDRVETDGWPVEVIDTVGAGDAFTSGLLARLAELDALQRRDNRDIPAELLADAIAFATQASAITCTRPGADPPRRQELTDRSS